SGTFVVERKLGSAVSDAVDAAFKCEPIGSLLWVMGLRRSLGVDRANGIERERVLDVSQNQFLVLLLVMQAKLDERNDAGPLFVEQAQHGIINIVSVVGDLRDPRSCDHAAGGTRMPRTDGLVIGIEEIAVAIGVGPIARDMGREHEGL